MRIHRNERLAEWAGHLAGELSLRQIELRTGISYSTVKNVLEGKEVGADTVIRFARGFHQSIPCALRIAGYEDIAEVWEERSAGALTPPDTSESEATLCEQTPPNDDAPPVPVPAEDVAALLSGIMQELRIVNAKLTRIEQGVVTDVDVTPS